MKLRLAFLQDLRKRILNCSEKFVSRMFELSSSGSVRPLANSTSCISGAPAEASLNAIIRSSNRLSFASSRMLGRLIISIKCSQGLVCCGQGKPTCLKKSNAPSLGP